MGPGSNQRTIYRMADIAQTLNALQLARPDWQEPIDAMRAAFGIDPSSHTDDQFVVVDGRILEARRWDQFPTP